MIRKKERIPEKEQIRRKEQFHMIYADNAATTKMSPAAIRTMTAMMEEVWGNPSSLYGL